MKEYWINVYPHGLGAIWYYSAYDAGLAANKRVIYRIHVRLK